MTKVRLVDVAAQAGVSKSTVSQYLSGRFDYMSKDTKERIQQAIAELNYVPNSIARSLKTNITKTIGIIARDVTGFYTSRTIRGVDDYCKSSDYNVLIYNTDFDPDKEAQALNNLRQINVDGIIISPSGTNTDLINNFVKQGLPIVQFQLEHDGSEKNIILSDYKKAAFDASEYLIQLGHRRICFVTQDFEHVKSRRDRYLGYCEALAKHGIALDQELIQYWHRGDGFLSSPLSLLEHKNPPTAYFTQHLAITSDLLKRLNQTNLKIGEDISLISFEDIPMVEFFKTPITVIKEDPYKIGMEAAKSLLGLIQDKSTPPKRLVMPCTLTIRDSCHRVA
ncbi:Catabolite control protein A [Zhongshania aliphaticivorans]|uniref:Catabolite control protein A n=1 Tax=Zhongshania aliphaticivorans TaxID=1470434 RepID=A0A5S9N289_9GAMM|nr:LacI family DNA-binding transcriptional regulator [Zhongshania aliphaticivorans]CAA0082822.1 Catabolite control protein A [Zhongshania aliphaticivorans]CAA0083968.1 Catabolite control protein A [Zhongshania aliphaticivorans]